MQIIGIMDELIKSISEISGWVLHYLINHDDAELLGFKKKLPRISFWLEDSSDFGSVNLATIRVSWIDPSNAKLAKSYQRIFSSTELLNAMIPSRDIAYFLVAEIVTKSKFESL